jgi:hypothetical protein
LKKRSKKLLTFGVTLPKRRAPIVKSFLVLFFKKEHTSYLLLSPATPGPAASAAAPAAPPSCHESPIPARTKMDWS